MKTTVLSVLGCVIIATGALQARAQTTNVTLNVNIALTGVAQTNGDSVARVRIGTRDVINAIGGTNTTFSTRAKLVAISSLGGGGGPSFVIREGTNDTAVADGVLQVSQVGDPVGTSKTTTTGLITDSRTTIQRFVLATDTLSFDVQGYTTESANNRGTGREILPETATSQLTAKVSGTGSGPSVLQGTISASGRKIVETP